MPGPVPDLLLNCHPPQSFLPLLHSSPACALLFISCHLFRPSPPMPTRLIVALELHPPPLSGRCSVIRTPYSHVVYFLTFAQMPSFIPYPPSLSARGYAVFSPQQKTPSTFTPHFIPRQVNYSALNRRAPATMGIAFFAFQVSGTLSQAIMF